MRHVKENFLPIITDKIDSFMAERFRAIMTNLQFMKTETNEPLKSIVFTSAHKSEGKSFCALNLAVAYAKQNKRVLLIDADMHKPKLSSQFKLRYAEGLSTLLSDTEDPMKYIVETEDTNLSVLPSGAIPPNQLELLNTERMQEMIAVWEEAFDLVIFDTPPVLLMNDSRILGSFCDGVVLVVRNGSTKVKDVEASIDLLARAEGRLIGTILNGKKYAAKELKTYSYY
ncbi:CpsD/CapB family tyrosine-protein kinase [Listeria booriae]|uniref:CpsD/CapB family tyrosine-protein kinase n=1 Tax=Listeria booriae TaxID=1552123 RepID=UPI00162929EB|nr:CpsD/CapB family tyrosine-protein kinase [Listeria booriae]MBC1813675.1 CpsD/CapB family tyrosine-protein kinase [Listeria booriae]MBC2322040.1 CpsD/CapB family tyrosine-protein kinase [Listeria booriae]MCD2205445.1 CpsD/CapB family tyrosine-protein kinase [Listeria booriae]